MGSNSAIEWTTHTWNPWMGCHKVSQGCKNCYMFREQKQYGNDPNVVRRSKTKFNEPLKWSESARVFTCSWSDWFIEEADPWRDEAWEIIRTTPHLTYQILTKRPENILERLPIDWGDGWSNVWLGVSAEDQENADKRVNQLWGLPARVKFVSAEPLLDRIDFSWAFGFIDWVIVGGESGPGSRPMDIGWARQIRRQCREAGVAFFMKQMGGWPNKHGDIPEDLQVFEFPNGGQPK